jgi:hypothetical protein
MYNKSLIRNIFSKNKTLFYFWKSVSYYRALILVKIHPRAIANNSYKAAFGRNANWENPTDLIEKIQWLQLYSDTTQWTICADKYLVREYVKSKGCEHLLNELYASWETAEDFEIKKLPHSFVLKANHSCGQVIIVKDKSTLDMGLIRKNLANWLKTTYGFTTAQFHYTRIKPRILAERLLINHNDIDNSLVDYKVWCFHGLPECILVVYNRTKNDYSLSLYDLEWNNISECAFNPANRHYSGVNIPKPESLDQMLLAATKLSQNFPQVRVDFYDIKGKAVFGEMTFTTGFGYFSDEYYRFLGSNIDLSNLKSV